MTNPDPHQNSMPEHGLPFDGKNIVLWSTALDPDNPGRKTAARAHLEQDGHLLLHRHFLIDGKGNERMMIELRMTRK